MRIAKNILLILICIASFVGALYLVVQLPQFGKADNPAYNEVYEVYTKDSAEDTGIPNIVTSIVLDYRAYDTMFETIVLFTATIAAVAALKTSKKREEKEKE